MAFVKVAENTAVLSGITYLFELYQEGGTLSSTTLKILDAERIAGSPSAGLLDPILPTQITLQVRDTSRYLLGLFADQGEDQFRLDVKVGGTLKHRMNVLLGQERPELNDDHPVITIKAWDGISRLRSKTYDLTGNKTVAELFRDLLNGVGHDIDTVLYFDWEHDNQSTLVPDAEGIRHSALDWLEGEESRTYYEVLERLALFYQCQVKQDGGLWRVSRRAYRGGTMTYVQMPYGGGASSTGTDDRRVPLTNNQIQRRKSVEPFLPPIPKAVSRYKFGHAKLKNARFEEWDSATAAPLGWTVAGSVSRVQSGDKFAARHDSSSDSLSQNPSEPLFSGDRVSVTFDIDPTETPGFLAGTALANVPIGRITLTDTYDGTDRCVLADGTITTTPTDVLVTAISGKDIYKVVEFTVPLTGDPIAPLIWSSCTIKLETKFSLDPDGNATNDYTYFDFREVSYEVTRILDPIPQLQFKSESGVETTLGEVDETFRVGDFTRNNPGASVIYYLDNTSGTWKPTYNWGNSGTLPYIHYTRAQNRVEQQKRRVRGLDIELGPDVDLSISDTLQYDGGDRDVWVTSDGDTLVTSDSDTLVFSTRDYINYIPVYERESYRARARRVLAWELREDASTASDSTVPVPAPTARPSPRISLEFVPREDNKYDVYLIAERDENTACIQWEYEEDATIRVTGVDTFGGDQVLRIKVNTGFPYAIDDTNPKVRAWGWSSYDSSTDTGKGVRQARVWERTLPSVAFPEATYKAEFKPEVLLQVSGQPERKWTQLSLWLNIEAQEGAVAVRFGYEYTDGVYYQKVYDLENIPGAIGIDELESRGTRVVAVNTSYISTGSGRRYDPGDNAYLEAEVYLSVADATAVKDAIAAQIAASADPDPDAAIASEGVTAQIKSRRLKAHFAADGQGEPVRVFDTVALVKAASTPKDRIAYGTRRYSPTIDTGKGLYLWDPASTSADDGGRVLKPDSITHPDPGRYHLVASDDLVYNVLSYGLDNTGSNSCTVALQAIIDAATAGSEIYFPAGTYLFTDPDANGIACKIEDKKLSITGDFPGTIFQGDGEFDILRKTATSTDGTVRATHLLSVDGITFDCRGGAVGLVVYYDAVAGYDYVEVLFGTVLFKPSGKATSGRNSAGIYLVRAREVHGDRVFFEGPSTGSSLVVKPAPSGGLTHMARWKDAAGLWQSHSWQERVNYVTGKDASHFLQGYGIYSTKSTNPAFQSSKFKDLLVGTWMDGGYGDNSADPSAQKGSPYDAGARLANQLYVGCWRGIMVHYNDHIQMDATVMADYCDLPLTIYGNDGVVIDGAWFAMRSNQDPSGRAIAIKPYEWLYSEVPNGEQGWTGHVKISKSDVRTYSDFTPGTLSSAIAGTVTSLPVTWNTAGYTSPVYDGQKIYLEEESGGTLYTQEFTANGDTAASSSSIAVTSTVLSRTWNSGLQVKFGVSTRTAIELERVRYSDIRGPIVQFWNEDGLVYSDCFSITWWGGFFLTSTGAATGYSVHWDYNSSRYFTDTGSSVAGIADTNRFYAVVSNVDHSIADASGNSGIWADELARLGRLNNADLQLAHQKALRLYNISAALAFSAYHDTGNTLLLNSLGDLFVRALGTGNDIYLEATDASDVLQTLIKLDPDLGPELHHPGIGAVLKTRTDGVNLGDATLGYYVNGTQVVGAQATAIADVSGGTTVDTEARAALNDLLAKLRTHGIIAT